MVFPIAPAKWATAVSTLIIRSRFAMRAAVSAKSFKWVDQSMMGKPAFWSGGAICRLWN